MLDIPALNPSLLEEVIEIGNSAIYIIHALHFYQDKKIRHQIVGTREDPYWSAFYNMSSNAKHYGEILPDVFRMIAYGAIMEEGILGYGCAYPLRGDILQRIDQKLTQIKNSEEIPMSPNTIFLLRQIIKGDIGLEGLMGTRLKPLSITERIPHPEQTIDLIIDLAKKIRVFKREDGNQMALEIDPIEPNDIITAIIILYSSTIYNSHQL